MDTYRAALKAYLSEDDRTQAKLAEAIRVSQVAVSRYVSGARFPDSGTAREIDKATAGEVSFAIWQEEAGRRLGFDLPASEAA